MKSVQIDKIASVTMNCGIRRDVRLSDSYACKEGDVLAVRVLNSKSTYNSLELTTGRMSTIKAGDVLAGALGHRNALQGYTGRIPNKIKTGDTLHVLNLGGVLGECLSYSPTVGAPLECEVLGSVLHFPFLASRFGLPANIASQAEPLESDIATMGIPVIAVLGTCMNSGKTEACLTLIQQLVRSGLRVAACKATGVSLRRDILAMEDAGAFSTMIFTDLGIVTTSRENAANVARTLLTSLARKQPDVLVLELGDGLLGEYGVDSILESTDIRASLSAIVLAAGDPVGAWGGVQLLRDRYELVPSVVTGPATDNGAGTSQILRETGVPGINARQMPAELLASLKPKLEVSIAN